MNKTIRTKEQIKKPILTRQYLHKLEMELVDLCEDNKDKEVMREAIIDKFTDLMNRV